MSHSNTKQTDRSLFEQIFGFIISRVFYFYIWIVARTSRFDMQTLLMLQEAQMVGYWHGDSMVIMALMNKYKKQLPPVDVVITADWRGDVISYLLERSGGTPFRAKDGAGIRESMLKLREVSSQEGRIFALSMDGPLGPRHEAKSLLPHLAKKANQGIRTITFETKPLWSLKKRWDHYVIPLPFGKIKAVLKDGM